MRIKDARRLRMEPSPRGFNTLGRFTLEAFDGLSVFDFTLVRAPDGRAVVHGPPSKAGGRLVSMAADVRQDVIKMALNALGIDNDGVNKAA